MSRTMRAYMEGPGRRGFYSRGDTGLDDRFPAGTGSAAILAVKAHFELEAAAGGCVILERMARPPVTHRRLKK